MKIDKKLDFSASFSGKPEGEDGGMNSRVQNALSSQNASFNVFNAEVNSGFQRITLTLNKTEMFQLMFHVISESVQQKTELDTDTHSTLPQAAATISVIHIGASFDRNAKSKTFTAFCLHTKTTVFIHCYHFSFFITLSFPLLYYYILYIYPFK